MVSSYPFVSMVPGVLGGCIGDVFFLEEPDPVQETYEFNRPGLERINFALPLSHGAMRCASMPSRRSLASHVLPTR